MCDANIQIECNFCKFMLKFVRHLKMNECCKLSMFAAHVPLQMTHILKHKLTKVALDMYGCSACASSNDSHT